MDNINYIAKLEQEIQRLRNVIITQSNTIVTTLAPALGYPLYCDDQDTFPNTDPSNGYNIGDNTAESLAMEAADKLQRNKQ